MLHNDEFVKVNEVQHDCKNPLINLTCSDAAISTSRFNHDSDFCP